MLEDGLMKEILKSMEQYMKSVMIKFNAALHLSFIILVFKSILIYYSFIYMTKY